MTSRSRNNKGFIFTLDAIIAAFILIFVLIFVHFAANRSIEDKLALVQPASIVSDAITFLDHNQTLQTKDKALIQATLTQLIPSSLQTRIHISFSTNAPAIDIGEEIPKGTFISSGKRYISIGTDYAIVRYWVWHAA